MRYHIGNAEYEVTDERNRKIWDFGIIQLTQAGCELSRIITVDFDEQYRKDLIENHSKRGYHFTPIDSSAQ